VGEALQDSAVLLIMGLCLCHEGTSGQCQFG
jgi:hypothetical protein